MPLHRENDLPTDDDIVEMIFDAFDRDPLIPWDADIDVSSDAGTVTLTGTVANKRIKHAAGDDAWWVAGVDDVRNQIRVSGAARDEPLAEPSPVDIPVPEPASSPAVEVNLSSPPGHTEPSARSAPSAETQTPSATTRRRARKRSE
jgi:hypothetical protein